MKYKYSSTLWMGLLSLFVAVACSKKSDGGSSSNPEPQTVVTTQNCNGGTCFAGNMNISTTGTVASNVQFMYPYDPNIQGVVNIYAVNSNVNNNTVVNGWNNSNQVYGNGNVNIAAYYGQVALQGQMTISGNLCGAPAGTYNFQSVQPSNMAYGVISSGQLVANGPVQITLNMYNSILYSSYTRIGFNWQVLVNGTPCGVVATY